MEISDIARTMSARMPWPVGRKILAEVGLPRAQGWEKTIALFSDEKKDYSAKLDEAVDALVEHHLCGEKLVSLFQLDAETKAILLTKAAELTPPESALKDVYPVYLTPNDLEVAPNKPTLIAVEETSVGIGVVFSSARVVTVRELLDPNDFKDGLNSDYEEIYGLKHQRHQAMDIVWIPKQGNFAEIRIDFPDGMHRDVGAAAQAQVATAFSMLVGVSALEHAQNLFPLIGKMYNSQYEGTVVELAFGTTTASNKHEKMRRRGLCLREETYHMAGKAALDTPIEPYRLSIVWKLPIGRDKFSGPELSLNSTSRSSAQPFLTQAIVRNCLGYADFDHVKERMEDFISQDE